MSPRLRDRRRVGECRRLLRAHRLRGVALGRLAVRAVVQRQRFGMAEHCRLRRSTFAVVGDVLAEMPVEIPLGERRVVPCQRGQHLLGVARRGLIGLTDGLGALDDLRARLAHPHRPDVLLRVRRRRVHPDAQTVLHEIPVLVVAPQLAPGLAVRHHGAPAGAPHLGVEVARLLRGELRALDAPRGDQQMRVPVRPLGVRVALPPRLGVVWRVHVELHGKTLGDEVLLGERPCQLDAVLGGDTGVGRQRQHDLAGDLRVLAFLGGLRRVPQHRAVGEPCVRALGQQHLMVLRRVTVLEVIQLPGALRGDGRAFVVGGRAHGAATGAAGDVARAGELDGHGGMVNQLGAASQVALPCNAYCVCTLTARLRLAGAEPAARFSSSCSRAGVS